MLALALALGALVGLESAWREVGHLPSVTDDSDLWAYQRSRVYRRGRNTLVLAGLSRIHTDFATQTFREHYPDYDVVQLAVNGRHPLAVLEDLALDEEFSGIVLCSVLELSFIGSVAEEQRLQVDHYHRSQPIVLFERAAMAWIEERWALLNDSLRLLRVFEGFVEDGALPSLPEGIMLADRSVASAVPLKDRELLRTRRLRGERRMYVKAEVPSPASWLRSVELVEPLVERLRSRGGQVVFLRIPVAPELYAIDEESFPKAKYWSRIGEGTSAVALHFEEIDGMADLEFADYSHLNYSEAPRFTLMLADELVRRGVLRPGD
jgi:hypothetical protein